MKNILLLAICALASCSRPQFVTRGDMNEWFFQPLTELPPAAQAGYSAGGADVSLYIDSIRTLSQQLESRDRENAELDAELLRVRGILGSRTSFDLRRDTSVILEGVTFQTNSAQLTGISERILENAWIALELEPSIRVEIAGYTDDVGSDAGNEQLSLERATVVRDWLVGRGISADRLTVVGRGSDNPLESNETEAGRSANRRIEFHVLE